MTIVETALTAFELNLCGLMEALNKQVSDPLVALWRRKFGYLPDELFGRAVALAVDECSFFPSPAEFGRFVEAALSPEERSLLKGLRVLRGWLAAGMVPANWDAPKLRRTRLALGLGEPSAVDMAYLARCRAERGWPEVDPPSRPGPGTLEACLCGERGDGGVLLVLASGGAS